MKSANWQRTSVPQYLEHEHFNSLDGLRGLAILIVILVHFGLNHYLRFIHFRVDSRFGVDIFFVLSGFLITTNLLKEKARNGNIDLGRFYFRRVLRIIPVVYLYLLVLISLSILIKPLSSKADFLYSFLFLKNLPIPNQRFTAHLWTLAVEWQFYLAFPLLLVYLGIKRTLLLSIGAGLILPLLCIAYRYGHLQGFYPFDIAMKGINYTFWKGPIVLLIGSVAAQLSFKGYLRLPRNQSTNWLCFLLFLVSLLFNVKDLFLYKDYISQYFSAIFIALMILFNLQTENPFSSILQAPWLRKIGTVSYSLYVWQQLFIGGHFYLPGLTRLNQLPLPVLMIIKLIFVFLIAYLSYNFFEKRFLKMKESTAKRMEAGSRTRPETGKSF